MKIVSILLVTLLCQGGFAQVINTDSFRLDHKIQEKEIVQSDELRISPYSLHFTRELALFGTAGVMIGMGAVRYNDTAPLTEMEVALLDPNDVPKFDRATITTYRKDRVGDIMLVSSVFLPLAFFFQTDTKKDMGTLGLMAAEVFLLQLGVNFLAKGLFERVRPFTYDEDSPIELKTTENAKRSFFSGHTSTAAAMSFYVAKVFSDYLPNRKTKTIIWTAAALYPALMGYMRIDSGSHFRTDVIIGYAVGALIGYLIPVLHKNKLKDNLSVHSFVTTDKVIIGLSYTF